MEEVLEYNAKIYIQKSKIAVHKEMMFYIENKCDGCQTCINACSLSIVFEDHYYDMILCHRCFDDFVITYEDFINHFHLHSIKTFIYGNNKKILQTSQNYIISNLFLQ